MVGESECRYTVGNITAEFMKYLTPAYQHDSSSNIDISRASNHDLAWKKILIFSEIAGYF